MDKQIKVAVYTFFSQISDSQKELTIDYAKKMFGRLLYYKPDWKVEAAFFDVIPTSSLSFFSAKERPEFNKLIDACASGQFDLVLTTMLSAISIDFNEVKAFVQKLRSFEKPVPVFFAKEGLHSFEQEYHFLEDLPLLPFNPIYGYYGFTLLEDKLWEHYSPAAKKLLSMGLTIEQISEAFSIAKEEISEMIEDD